MIENNTTTSTSILAREIQIRTLQNKITIFVIALVLFVVRPFISDARDSYKASLSAYQAAQQKHQDTELQHKTVVDDLGLLQKVNAAESTIIQCYNTNCSTLPEALRNQPQKNIFKAYLQLQQTTKTKFTIDQKKVLQYLNEFLTKSSDGTVNGEIQAISFAGAQDATAGGLVRIPMSITMTFQNKQGLLAFLRNIEQLISPTFPMLGIVQSVSYDIVKSDASQDVVIAMDIYMLQ